MVFCALSLWRLPFRLTRQDIMAQTRMEYQIMSRIGIWAEQLEEKEDIELF